MLEITIKDNLYSVGKMSGRQQFHVARRLAPALFGMAKGAVEVGGDPSVPEDMKAFASLEPLVKVMSQMTDEDANYVLDSCMSVVRRRQTVAGNVSHAHVLVAGNLIFEDMDMAVQLQLALAVIQDNLGNFMSALSGSSLDGAISALN